MKQLISAAVAALFLAVTFAAPAQTVAPSVTKVADDTSKKKETKKKKAKKSKGDKGDDKK